MIGLLSAYLFVKSTKNTDSYITHAIVYKWAYHYHAKQMEADFGLFAIYVVGWVVLISLNQDYSMLQQQLLPHT